MNLFKPKYRILAEQLAVELDSTKQELNFERARRISAEAVSEERRERCEHAEAFAQRAEASRDEAIIKRLTSIDLVNNTLLGALGPEKPGPDPKNFKPLPRANRQAVPMGRALDRIYFQEAARRAQGSKAKPPTKEESTDIVAAQMEALSIDAFFPVKQ